MTHKQSIQMEKPWSHMASFALHVHEIAAKVRKAMSINVPTGYQDETGFHVGVEPAAKEVKWPPAW